MPPKQDQQLQWIAIEDFSPGIITNSQLAYSASSGLGNTGPVPGNKVGQAQSAVGCISLPNGGLGPLPGLFKPTWSSTQPIAPLRYDSTTGATNQIIGLFHTPSLGSAYGYTDELIIGNVYANSTSATCYLYLTSWQFSNTSSGLAQNDIYANSTANWVGYGPNMTGGFTRAGATYTAVNPGVWAFAIYVPNAATTYSPYTGIPSVQLYPNPTASSPSFTSYQLNIGSNSAGVIPSNVIVHQNRIVELCTLLQNWPTPGSFQTFAANEIFNYTDPPNSITLGTQNEAFVQEHPSGYGAWGSVSASELFLVKNEGGGVVISGDLNAPTVTALPGVQSTHGLMSRAASTSVGIIYGAYKNGLWAWNGGNTSNKISQALNDDAFYNSSLAGSGSSGPQLDICKWGDWVVTTNDWLLDTTTGAWWKLTPAADNNPHYWFQTSTDDTTLYASLATPTATHQMDFYNKATPTNSFTWKSYPLRAPSFQQNREMLVEELVVRCQGNGTVTLVVEGVGATTSAAASSPGETLTFTTTAQPSMQRMRIGSSSGGPMRVQDLTVSITSTGATATTPAPIVYALAVGYSDASALVSAT